MATLATAREYLERELSQARSRADVHLIGERICEVMEMEELEEQRMLRTPTIETNDDTAVGDRRRVAAPTTLADCSDASAMEEVPHTADPRPAPVGAAKAVVLAGDDRRLAPVSA